MLNKFRDHLKRPSFKVAIAAVALLLFVSLFVPLLIARDHFRPSIILIVVDTLRADHLSHYGYDLDTAAALDEFRSHATMFTNAYSPSPWTGPSVASLFTGLLPPSHRANAHGARLGDDALTLPEVLQQNRWYTVGHSFNIEIAKKTGYDQGFDKFYDVEGDALAYPDIAEMKDSVVDWLERYPPPFFLYMQPMNVHGPYRVPQEHRNALLGRKPSPGFTYYGDLMKGIMFQGKLNWRGAVTSEYVRSLSEQYDTAVRYSMDEIGRLFEYLKSRELYDSSLIILTGDHGEELFDHGGFSHGFSLYNEVLHVPLYIKLPDQRKGREVADRVSLADIYPTILNILGIDVEHRIDGLSLMNYLPGHDGVPRKQRTLLQQTEWKGRCIARAIVSENYKLINIKSNYEGERNSVRLYDIKRDPYEVNNLSRRRPDVALRLLTELNQTLASLNRYALNKPENVLQQMDLDKLKSLGYIGAN